MSDILDEIPELDRWVTDQVRETALAALSTIILATPVVTGRARGNWMVDIGAANERQTDRTGAQAAISEGASEIGRFKLADPSIVIHNSLPYIGRLNEGSSRQAPAGFVERAVDVAVNS